MIFFCFHNHLKPKIVNDNKIRHLSVVCVCLDKRQFIRDGKTERDGACLCVCVCFRVLQLCVLVWSSHVFLLVIVLPQGISSTANLIRFHLCCSAEHWNHSESRPTPCPLFRKQLWERLRQEKEKFGTDLKLFRFFFFKSDDRRDGNWMKWMVIGCRVRQRKLFSISKKNQQLFLNLKSQMWDKRAHLHKIIKGKFVSLCFFTISSALSFLLLINFSSSLLWKLLSSGYKGPCIPTKIQLSTLALSLPTSAVSPTHEFPFMCLPFMWLLS